MKRTLIGTLALVGVVALAAVSTAGGSATQKGKGKPSKSATPVFKLNLKPSQEVPRIRGLRASAVGHVTFDLTRNEAGAITAGEVIFYFNYSFPGTVTISGLHIHQGAKGTNGGIVVDSGTSEPADADGQGNLTKVVSGSPATLQAILDNPRNHYVNLHTTTPDHPGGAVRAQMHNPKKR
ncbi:MAG: CHRD domain-containing protein [Gemmatimonadota bacterium]